MYLNIDYDFFLTKIPKNLQNFQQFSEQNTRIYAGVYKAVLARKNDSKQLSLNWKFRRNDILLYLTFFSSKISKFKPCAFLPGPQCIDQVRSGTRHLLLTPNAQSWVLLYNFFLWTILNNGWITRRKVKQKQEIDQVLVIPHFI